MDEGYSSISLFYTISRCWLILFLIKFPGFILKKKKFLPNPSLGKVSKFLKYQRYVNYMVTAQTPGTLVSFHLSTPSYSTKVCSSLLGLISWWLD